MSESMKNITKCGMCCYRIEKFELHIIKVKRKRKEYDHVINHLKAKWCMLSALSNIKELCKEFYSLENSMFEKLNGNIDSGAYLKH